MGCDTISFDLYSWTACFNPRTRMGCDVPSLCLCSKDISFNPRTRMGCDPLKCAFILSASCFNPRTRMGCDMFIIAPSTIMETFQSTHPHGVRHPITRFYILFHYVSIHALAWGATKKDRLGLMAIRCFNPRTRMGCDLNKL